MKNSKACLHILKYFSSHKQTNFLKANVITREEGFILLLKFSCHIIFYSMHGSMVRINGNRKVPPSHQILNFQGKLVGSPTTSLKIKNKGSWSTMAAFNRDSVPTNPHVVLGSLCQQSPRDS